MNSVDKVSNKKNENQFSLYFFTKEKSFIVCFCNKWQIDGRVGETALVCISYDSSGNYILSFQHSCINLFHTIIAIYITYSPSAYYS